MDGARRKFRSRKHSEVTAEEALKKYRDMIVAQEIKLKNDMEAQRMKRLGLIEDEDDEDDMPESLIDHGPSQAMIDG